MRGVRFAQATEGKIYRHAIDQVGNNLSAELRWCSTHIEPVWVYGDGSFICPHEETVGWAPDGHEIRSFPWLVHGDDE